MAYYAEWYVPYRVLDTRLSGQVTVKDMELHADACVRMLNEAQIHAPDSKVCLLFDALEAENMPPMYSMLPLGVRVLRYRNRGPAYIVVRDRKIRSVLEVTAHVSRFSARTFETRPDALRAIEAYLTPNAMP